LAPLAWTLDHVGAITRSVADNAIVLGVLCGFDPTDPGSAKRAPEDFTRDLFAGVAGLRIGVPGWFYEYLDPEVRSCVNRALRVWEESGCVVEEVEVAELDRYVAAQRTVLAGQAYSVHRRRFQDQPDLFQDKIRHRLQEASRLPAWQYAEAHRQIGEAKAAFDRLLREVDVLVAATVPIVAPMLGQRDADAAGRTETV
jgi:aspartyl-tRNA(Asn)/glutamyl-tRNA(Gln) amidotransferase subunit A